MRKPKIPAKKQVETEAIFVRGVEKPVKTKLAKLASNRNMTIGAYLNALIKEQE
jgi:hypothetical protein